MNDLTELDLVARLGRDTEPPTAEVRDAARDAFVQLSNKYPHQPEVAYAIGVLSYELKDYEEAERSLRDALAPMDGKAQELRTRSSSTGRKPRPSPSTYLGEVL